MIGRKILRGFGFLLKFGWWETVKRHYASSGDEPRGVTKLYLLTHSIDKIDGFARVPTFSTVRIWRRIRKARSVKIFLTQLWGGGADMYLHHQIVGLERETIALLVKPFAFGEGLLVEVWQSGVLVGERVVRSLDALDPLQGMSCSITVNSLIQWHLLYSGEISNATLHKTIGSVLRLKERLRAPLAYFVHDYYCVCPKINLTDSEARYCGSEGNIAKCVFCLHDVHSVGGLCLDNGLSVQEWRSDFAHLLHACAEVRTFSEDARNRIAGCYGALPLTVVPHKLTVRFNKLPRISRNNGIVIGVFGGIGKIKGARVVLALARHILSTGRNDAKIVIVGSLNEVEENVPQNIKVLGGYKVADLPEIVEREGINIGLMPSVWPETFSYTTHEMMALGLPVVCFDIGAPKDAVKQYCKGAVAPNMTVESLWQTLLELWNQVYRKEEYER